MPIKCEGGDKFPKKMREYHLACINLKILMNLKPSHKNFIRDVTKVLPFATKNFNLQHKLNKKNFFEKEIEQYFVQNIENCKNYLLWKKTIKIK